MLLILLNTRPSAPLPARIAGPVGTVTRFCMRGDTADTGIAAVLGLIKLIIMDI
jgi:hypothetical protein